MKRFVMGLAITIFVSVALGVGAFFGVGYYLSPQSPLSKADTIVAISGGETDSRTAEAVKLYHDGWASNIIFSGAALDPNGPSNARAMARSAVAAGVPAVDIQLDEDAANTRQNAADVREIIRRQNYQSIILVTSPYHQRRAYIAFRRELGAQFFIVNHSSIDDQWRRSHWWATVYSRSITISEMQKIAYELISGQSK